MPTLREDARLARLVRAPEQAAVQAAGRRGGRALPRVRPRRASFRTRPSGSTRPATRARRSSSRCAITSASRATSSCRPPATAPTTARWSTRAAPAAARRAASRPSGATSPIASCATLHDAGVRGVRFNFVKRLVDFTPRDELAEIAARIEPLGWHVVVYFEARDLPELWDFFTALPTTVVVDHMGRPDVTKPIDGPEFGLFLRPHARARERLDQGELPRAPVGQRAAGARRRARRRTATSCRSRAAWSRAFPTACSGAPTGRTRT